MRQVAAIIFATIVVAFFSADVLVESDTPKTLDEISLSRTEYVYDGEEKTPFVTVFDDEGNEVDASDYTVVYENNVNAGRATVTVTALEESDYAGTLVAKFTIAKAEQKLTVKKSASTIVAGKKCSIAVKGAETTLQYRSGNKHIATVKKGKIKGVKAGRTKIVVNAISSENYKAAKKIISIKVKPKGSSIKALSSDVGGQMRVSWAKNKTAKYMEIQYSENRKFPKSQTTTQFAKADAGEKTIRGLTPFARYYVKIRACDRSKKIYSAKSKTECVRVEVPGKEGTIFSSKYYDLSMTEKFFVLWVYFPDGCYWNHHDYGRSYSGMNKYQRGMCVSRSPCHHSVASYCNTFSGMEDRLFGQTYDLQCQGFAEMVNEFLHGEGSPAYIAYGWNNIAVGDHIRLKSATHSFIVWQKSADTLTLLEVNADYRTCKIQWGRTMTRSRVNTYNWFIIKRS